MSDPLARDGPMHSSPLLDLHRDAGARVTPTHAGSLVLTHGDVPAEYRAGREGALLLDATRRGCLEITGADAPAFLHRILANHVLALAEGEGNANLLLSPKGKVQAWFDLFRTGEGFRCETAPGEAEALRVALDLYLFGEDVQLTDATESFAPLELAGPGAAAVLGAALPEFDRAASGTQLLTSALGSVRVRPAEVAGERGWRVDVKAGGTASLWKLLLASGATPGGLVAEDSLRTERLRPRWSVDASDEVYPQEARLGDAFALDKGCYVGQEVVAKIDTYGGLNKQLFALRVASEDPVPPGTRLLRTLDGEVRDLGLVTSWAYSFEHDSGLVLGYVKKRHQEPGTVFDLEGLGTQATLLAPPDAGEGADEDAQG